MVECIVDASIQKPPLSLYRSDPGADENGTFLSLFGRRPELLWGQMALVDGDVRSNADETGGRHSARRLTPDHANVVFTAHWRRHPSARLRIIIHVVRGWSEP